MRHLTNYATYTDNWSPWSEIQKMLAATLSQEVIGLQAYCLS